MPVLVRQQLLLLLTLSPLANSAPLWLVWQQLVLLLQQAPLQGLHLQLLVLMLLAWCCLVVALAVLQAAGATMLSGLHSGHTSAGAAGRRAPPAVALATAARTRHCPRLPALLLQVQHRPNNTTGQEGLSYATTALSWQQPHSPGRHMCCSLHGMCQRA